MKLHSYGRGFTLVELLTVIAIIGILAAILIPVIGRVRTSAQASRCTSNLHQIALAAQLYGNDNKGIIVPWRDQNKSNYWSDRLSGYLSLKKAPSGDVEDSVFMCPTEKPNLAGELYQNVQRIWSRYTLNIHITYGGEPGVSDSQRRAVRYAEVDYTAKTYLFIDLFGSVGGGSWMGPSLVYPHNDKVNVAFVDCHVEAKTKAEMDRYCQSQNRAFWQGYNWSNSASFQTD